MSALESFHLEVIFDTIFVVVCSVCSVIYGMSPYQQLHRTLGLGFTWFGRSLPTYFRCCPG